MILTVYETRPEERPTLVQVGTVTIGAYGVLSVETEDEGLQVLIASLEVTTDMRGTPIPPMDPHYPEAVADSIGRQSQWVYTAELAA